MNNASFTFSFPKNEKYRLSSRTRKQSSARHSWFPSPQGKNYENRWCPETARVKCSTGLASNLLLFIVGWTRESQQCCLISTLYVYLSLFVAAPGIDGYSARFTVPPLPWKKRERRMLTSKLRRVVFTKHSHFRNILFQQQRRAVRAGHRSESALALQAWKMASRRRRVLSAQTSMLQDLFPWSLARRTFRYRSILPIPRELHSGSQVRKKLSI